MDRRQFLAACTAGALAGLAGCKSDGTPTLAPGETATTAPGTPSDTPPPLDPRVLSVSTGEQYTIPAGETDTFDRADVDGVLTVQGTLTLT